MWLIPSKSDTEEVNLRFELDNRNLVIIVSGFVQRVMRRANQKNRVDIYILQDQFRPIIDIIPKSLDAMSVRHNPKRPFRYGQPLAREARQGVPELVKLAELTGIGVDALFDEQQVIVNRASAFIDSETPGSHQSKWQREGGSRQIHIGIFGGEWTRLDPTGEVKVVRVFIPVQELKYNLIEPALNNWVNV